MRTGNGVSKYTGDEYAMQWVEPCFPSRLVEEPRVGVMGDGRSYDQVLALGAVTSVDGMTADFFPFDMGFLGRVSTRIINEVKGINRVRMT